MEKKLKILHITPFFYPNVGGVETHLLDLIKALSKKYFFRVITYQALVGQKKGKQFEKADSVEITRIPWFSGLYYKSLKNYFLHFIYLTPRLFIGSLAYVINNKRNIDIFHAHGINAAYIGAILKKLFGKPFIVSMHVNFYFKEKNITTAFLLWPLQIADKILTLTNSSKEELVRFGLSENKIEVYSYWVDQVIFKPHNKKQSREKLALKKDKFTVLFVGRLAEEKGINIVLSLAEKFPNMQFVIAGSGDMQDFVERKAELQRNVTFVGKIENEKLPYYYSAADILLVPSLVRTPKPTFEEGVPRVIIEALSCGTPAIGTDNGGIKEVLESGKVGIVVDSSVDSFEDRLKDLTKSGAKLTNLARNCRNFAIKRFSYNQATTISQAYDELNIINKTEALLQNTGDMALKRRTKWILENLNLKKNDKILDVGCGDGFYLHLLSNLEPKLKLTGTDYDERGLASAKRNLKGKNIPLVKGDLMEKLPFQSNSFDKIIMSEVTEHLPDDVKGLKEVRRVLKPGGIALITVPHANYPFLWDPINWTLEHLFDTHVKSGFFAGIWNQHERLYEQKEIKNVVEKAGFKVLEQKYITWWCLPFNHYLINIGARILAKGIGKEITEGANKFVSEERRSLVPNIYFKVSNFIDKLNDILPIPSGTSVVTTVLK